MNSSWSYSPETPNLGQNPRFFCCVTLKFDGWPWKTIGQLFYATSSFVHHFVAIGESKLELQSGNAQFGSKLTIFFFSRVTLKFDGWPSKTIGHLFYATSSFVHHFVAIGQFKLELQSGNANLGQNGHEPCDLEMWWMTLKNDRAPLLSNIKLCASFHHHMWIQTGVTVRKWPSWGWPLWPWPLTLTFCMDVTSVIGNNSWKFHDDTMMGT